MAIAVGPGGADLDPAGGIAVAAYVWKRCVGAQFW